MTTPAIAALRAAGPQRELVLLTSSQASPAASLIPDIDRCIAYNAPWMKATSSTMNAAGDLDMIERLKYERFDGAVIFTVFSQNPLPAAMMCYLADIPLRLAYCHENPYQLLTDWIKDPDPDHGIRHEVQRQIDLIGSIGCPASQLSMFLRVPMEALESVAFQLLKKGIDTYERLVVIHPGATAPSRRYPAKNFVKAASSLVKQGFHVIFTGQDQERVLIEEIQDAMDVTSHSFIGALNFSQLAALISLARVVITNNTAPAHICSAVGTPVVDLYALTNPQHTPWQVPNRVLSYDVPCKYCFKSICMHGHHHCLEMVPWESVVEAVDELVKETEYVYTGN